jgi:hypothetical protein
MPSTALTHFLFFHFSRRAAVWPGLLQPRELGLGFFQNGNVWVGVFPEVANIPWASLP